MIKVTIQDRSAVIFQFPRAKRRKEVERRRTPADEDVESRTTKAINHTAIISRQMGVTTRKSSHLSWVEEAV
jgi:hypothetical protein